MISVISPFYNEDKILESVVTQMIEGLAELPEEWEFIIVNDGSTDGSFAIAQKLAEDHPRLRLISYPHNRGRGYALRRGISEAEGEIIVTTEIDGSWGLDIVGRIYDAFQTHPDADMIIASPHLRNGGYKNVPLKRVLFSTFGNWIIRAGLTSQITMNTGMTRGYRRDKLLSLPLFETDKEIHLEIVNKALAFGYRIYEIPAVLEWMDHKPDKVNQQERIRRRSTTKIGKIVRSHLLFSAVASPFRYIFPFSLLLGVMGFVFNVLAIYYLFIPGVNAVFFLIPGLLLFVFSFLTFAAGILSQQNRFLQKELWEVQRSLKEMKK